MAPEKLAYVGRWSGGQRPSAGGALVCVGSIAARILATISPGLPCVRAWSTLQSVILSLAMPGGSAQPMLEAQMVPGSCLCGGVQFEIRGGPPEHMSHCHCSRCRKFHGAAFGTYVGVPKERLTLSAGRELLKSYTTPNGTVRTFCRECGSSLFWANDELFPTLASIAAGTLDADPGSRPSGHGNVGSMAPWYQISDHLPQQR